MQEFIYGEAPRLALKANSTSLKDRACLIYQAIHLQTEGGTKTVRGSISDFIRGGQLPPEYYLSARTKKKVAQTTLIGRFVAGLAWLDENKYIREIINKEIKNIKKLIYIENMKPFIEKTKTFLKQNLKTLFEK